MQQIPQEITYKRTVVYKTVTFNALATNSSVVDLGGMQLRRINFPPAWVTCDVHFNSLDKTTPEFPCQIFNFDGTNSNILTLPNTTESTSVPLFAHFFDSVSYLQLVGSLAQTVQCVVQLVLQPIYQGVHG